MCDCVNIEVGSYDNQVSMRCWWNDSIIDVDDCIWKEIHFLWDNKIQTTGCCCGHNKVTPMINVIQPDHNKMISLGYKYWINEFDTICYKPLSIESIKTK